MAGELHVPDVYDRDAAATQIIQCTVARWKAIRPKEYAAWPKHCDEQRKRLLNGGWSQTKEMKLPFIIPAYVQWIVARIVKDTSWNFREERLINAFLREVPCSRMDPNIGTARSSALTQADKDRKWGS